MRVPGLADEEPPAGPEEALELVDLLLAELVAAATPPKIDYQGDGAGYQRDWKKLCRILDSLGIKPPFPWRSLDVGVAAAKAAHGGGGAYERRREFFNERANRVKELLQKRIDDDATGDVAAAVAEFGDLAGSVLADAAAVRAELARIEASLPRDPGGAIGKAKNLIEATAKAVLDELGESYEDKDEVNKLVHAAMQALGIDRSSVAAAHDVDLANVMQRLNGLTIALSDLRNHAGDAHGASTPPVGLDLRHGRLAVRAAVAWCAFMLDTLQDQSV